MGHPRPRRKRRRGGDRRRAGGDLQDGKPQPPQLHRALSGRGDRRGRHSARRVHHGRPSHRQPERFALRQPGQCSDSADRGWCGARHRRLRQLRRRADGRWGDQFSSGLRRQPAGQRHDGGHRAGGPDFPECRRRHRQPGGLCGFQDRARRYPWGNHGLGRVRRELRGKAPDRAGRRPLHGKTADRGLPGTDGHRRHRRHSGYGCGRSDQLVGRNGRQGRRRDRAEPGQRPGARNRHDGLRVHAFRKPGADAHGVEARTRSRGAGDFREVGSGFLHHRPHYRYRPHHRAPPGRGQGRHSAGAAERSSAAVYAPDGGDSEAGAAQCGADRGSPRSDRRTAQAAGMPRSVFARLGVGPVRQHRRRTDGEAPRRGRCGRGEAGRVEARTGADHRLHTALLSGRP